jgi:hypothetical protein
MWKSNGSSCRHPFLYLPVIIKYLTWLDFKSVEDCNFLFKLTLLYLRILSCFFSSTKKNLSGFPNFKMVISLNEPLNKINRTFLPRKVSREWPIDNNWDFLFCFLFKEHKKIWSKKLRSKNVKCCCKFCFFGISRQIICE